jgi:hypothetical protein
LIRKEIPGMKELLVVSASRRTDLAGCFPEVLRARLHEYPPEVVHSLVIWTKNPQKMLCEGPLREALRGYRQIYVHLTITGMGGGEFEPLIPSWDRTVKTIGPLTELVKDPRRISWRFDPLLEAEGNGKAYSNFEFFRRLAEEIAPYGIKTCRVSWVSPYKKVVARLQRKGWSLLSPDARKRGEQASELKRIAGEHGMEVEFCSMDGFPVSRCIDGELLSRLHPDGLSCSRERARGQRPLCGCTRSLDIGWYSLKCEHGCLYCYATP